MVVSESRNVVVVMVVVMWKVKCILFVIMFGVVVVVFFLVVCVNSVFINDVLVISLRLWVRVSRLDMRFCCLGWVLVIMVVLFGVWKKVKLMLMIRIVMM